MGREPSAEGEGLTLSKAAESSSTIRTEMGTSHLAMRSVRAEPNWGAGLIAMGSREDGRRGLETVIE